MNGTRENRSLLIDSVKRINGNVSEQMKAAKGLKLATLNSHLVCVLCKGYYVEATVIVECLHRFCRSCIIKYLKTNNFCPICEVQIQEAKPWLSLKEDKTIQDLVYKLVPGLYQDEMRRRRQFYSRLGGDVDVGEGEEGGFLPHGARFFSQDDSISLSLEYYSQDDDDDDDDNGDNGDEEEELSSKKMKQSNEKPKRYLQCPAAVTVRHLKKFVRIKYGIGVDSWVDIIYNDECLPENFSLIDVAYTFTWNRTSPMRFSYRIFSKAAIRVVKSQKVIQTSRVDEGSGKRSRHSSSLEQQKQSEYLGNFDLNPTNSGLCKTQSHTSKTKSYSEENSATNKSAGEKKQKQKQKKKKGFFFKRSEPGDGAREKPYHSSEESNASGLRIVSDKEESPRENSEDSRESLLLAERRKRRRRPDAPVTNFEEEAVDSFTTAKKLLKNKHKSEEKKKLGGSHGGKRRRSAGHAEEHRLRRRDSLRKRRKTVGDEFGGKRESEAKILGKFVGNDDEETESMENLKNEALRKVFVTKEKPENNAKRKDTEGRRKKRKKSRHHEGEAKKRKTEAVPSSPSVMSFAKDPLKLKVKLTPCNPIVKSPSAESSKNARPSNKQTEEKEVQSKKETPKLKEEAESIKTTTTTTTTTTAMKATTTAGTTTAATTTTTTAALTTKTTTAALTTKATTAAIATKTTTAATTTKTTTAAITTKTTTAAIKTVTTTAAAAAATSTKTTTAAATSTKTTTAALATKTTTAATTTKTTTAATATKTTTAATTTKNTTAATTTKNTTAATTTKTMTAATTTKTTTAATTTKSTTATTTTKTTTAAIKTVTTTTAAAATTATTTTSATSTTTPPLPTTTTSTMSDKERLLHLRAVRHKNILNKSNSPKDYIHAPPSLTISKVDCSEQPPVRTSPVETRPSLEITLVSPSDNAKPKAEASPPKSPKESPESKPKKKAEDPAEKGERRSGVIDSFGVLDLSEKSTRSKENGSNSSSPKETQEPVEKCRKSTHQTILQIAQNLVNRKLSPILPENRPREGGGLEGVADASPASVAMRNLKTLSDTAVNILKSAQTKNVPAAPESPKRAFPLTPPPHKPATSPNSTKPSKDCENGSGLKIPVYPISRERHPIPPVPNLHEIYPRGRGRSLTYTRPSVIRPGQNQTVRQIPNPFAVISRQTNQSQNQNQNASKPPPAENGEEGAGKPKCGPVPPLHSIRGKFTPPKSEDRVEGNGDQNGSTEPKTVVPKIINNNTKTMQNGSECAFLGARTLGGEEKKPAKLLCAPNAIRRIEHMTKNIESVAAGLTARAVSNAMVDAK